MSDRTRQVRLAADTERQLEGRAERIAAARRQGAELERVLASRRWRRDLTRRPELVPALVDEAEALEEALERVHRRAAREDWPRDTPVLREAREVEARRKRLAGLVRRRLEGLGVAAGDAPLGDALKRLDARVREHVRADLAPGEVLVFESATEAGRALLSLQALGMGAVLPLLVLPLALLVPRAFHPGGMLLLWGLGVALASRLRSGRVRLTSERLLWLPAVGEPRQVRLGTIPREGVHLERMTGDVRVEGDRRLRANGVMEAAELALLVELHRQAPLRGAARAGVRLDTVVVFKATLGSRKGWCVLGPQGLSFVPQGKGPQALQAITGHPTSLQGFDADRVLKALRWLPEADFDACVTRVVEATGGTSWHRDEVRAVSGGPSWQRILIEHKGMTLRGQLAWAQQEAARRLLREWPRREGEA